MSNEIFNIKKHLSVIRQVPQPLPESDRLNLTLEDLNNGGLVTVQGQVHYVAAKHRYSQEDGCEWFEFQVTRLSDNKTFYLEYEIDDEMVIGLSTEKVKIQELGLTPDQLERFDDDEDGSFKYEGKKYYYDESDVALFHKNMAPEGTEHYYWDFEDSSEDFFAGVEKWSDGFEAWTGKYLEQNDVSVLHRGNG